MTAEPKPTEDPVAETTDSVEALLRRAVAGDSAVLPDLRMVLRQPEVVDVLGNLARRIEGELVARLTGKDLAFREAVTTRLAAMRADLAGPNASPLERQLVERVVLSWLTLHEAEYRFANTRDLSVKDADYWQRRIDACHRRYLSAVKMLATVRKLAIPVLIGQVNIARNQVNLAAAPATAPSQPTIGQPAG